MISQPETVYRLERPLHAGDQATQDPVMAALPPGWVGLKDSNVSGLLNHAQRVAYVLLHPQVGVALLDFTPGQLDGAAAALHHRLEAARFEAIFPGHLPIAELTLAPAEVPALESILAAAFAALPPLTVPGGDGWISVVRRALQPRDPGRATTPAMAPVGGMRLVRPRKARGTPGGVAPPATGDVPAGPPIGTAPGIPIDAHAGASAAPRHRRHGVALGLLGGAALAGLVLAGVAMVWRGAEDGPPSAPVANLPPGVEPPQPAALPPPAPAMPAPLPSLAVPSVPRGSDATGAPTAQPPAARPAPPPALRPAPPPDARPTPPQPVLAAPPAPPPAAAARAVVRSAANLRAAPDNRARVLRTVPVGESFRIHGTAPGGWVQVGDGEPQGWIHSKLLRDSH